MKTNQLKKYLVFSLLISTILMGCYKEEHFDFPGPYDLGNTEVPDSLPFPFDKSRQAGKWLIKDGVPDYEKVLVKGYTDYVNKGDTLSWTQQADGLHLIPHRNYYPLSNADHFGGDPNSYQFNRIYSKYFVPVGQGRGFYMYAKVTFGTLNATAAALVLGTSWDTKEIFTFGLDGGGAEPKFFVNFYGTTIGVETALGWPNIHQVMTPGVPAELEVVISGGIFYMKINHTLVFSLKLGSDRPYFFTPQYRPWRNFGTIHDMYIESSEMYTLNYAMHEYEKGYNKIQAPALAKASNGDLLLFAEGRSNPLSANERVAQNTMPVGNTDIIMKRSSDGGTTWNDQIVVLAGDGSGSTFCFPQVVSLENGKIILHYTEIEGSFDATNTYAYNGNTQQVFQIESTDNGQTWSSPVEISAGLKFADIYLRNGPGHGIELKSAAYKNRLIMPLSYSSNRVRVAMSDDGGQTWRLGTPVAGSTFNYPSVVELADGRLMMIGGHTAASPRNRRVSFSTNGGQTWSAVSNISSTVQSGQFGHLYAGVTVKGKDGEILLITPTEREKDGETKNAAPYPTTPVAYKSTDDGVSFSNLGALFTKETYYGYAAPFGFMDAVVLDDGTVVIAGEGGVESPTEGIVIYKK